MGTPVWSHDGIICTGESYRKVVKLTFAKGAALKDPARLFNSRVRGLERFRTVEGDRLANQRLEGELVNFLCFVDVDRPAHVSVETRARQS